MITINLLPVKQIQKRLQARNQLFLLVGFVVALVVVLALVGFGLNHKISNLKQTTAALEEEKNSYLSTLNEIEKLKQDKAALEKQLAVIAKLKKSSQVTVRILDEMANITPANKLWLSTLAQVGNQLQFSGIALDNAIIADYMEAIDGSYLFANPELLSSAHYMTGGQRLKSFSMTCNVVPPAEEEQQNEG